MAKKSSKNAAEAQPNELSIGEKALLEKYAERMATAVTHKYYSAIPQTDMLQLHAIYKRWVNRHHVPNVFCGNCNMTVLKGLYEFLKKQANGTI